MEKKIIFNETPPTTNHLWLHNIDGKLHLQKFAANGWEDIGGGDGSQESIVDEDGIILDQHLGDDLTYIKNTFTADKLGQIVCLDLNNLYTTISEEEFNKLRYAPLLALILDSTMVLWFSLTTAGIWDTNPMLRVEAGFGDRILLVQQANGTYQWEITNYNTPFKKFLDIRASEVGKELPPSRAREIKGATALVLGETLYTRNHFLDPLIYFHSTKAVAATTSIIQDILVFNIESNVLTSGGNMTIDPYMYYMSHGGTKSKDVFNQKLITLIDN